MEILLEQKKQILTIRGKDYECNLDDLKSYDVINEFAKYRQTKGVEFNDSMLEICKHTIDTVLGVGAYTRIFGDEKTILPYDLCIKLFHIYDDHLIQDEKEMLAKKKKEEVAQVESITRNMRDFTQTMSMAQKKYGTKQKRPTKGYNNKRH